MADADVVLRVKQTGFSELNAELNRLRSAAGGSETKFLELAGALSRTALAAGDAVRAERILEAANKSSGLSAIQAAKAQRELAAAEKQASAAAGAGAAYGNALKDSLLNIVGPTAAVAAGFGVLRSALGAAEEGFKIQASLDASRASIDILLRGVRNSGEVFAGAARFGQTYKLTQQEVTEATQASVRVLRSSKAPVEDVLGVFAKLKVLAPEKTFSDAARALGELQAGQLVSLEKMFNVPLSEAHKMKEEIDKGGDAVQILNNYLDRTGVTMEAVRKQAEGGAGAIREQAQEQERLNLALAGNGSKDSLGLGILQERITLTRGLANVLSGNIAVTNDSARAFDHYSQSVAAVGGALRGDFGAIIALQSADATSKEHEAAAALAAVSAIAQFNAIIAAGIRPTAETIDASDRHAFAMTQEGIRQDQLRDESVRLTSAVRILTAVQRTASEATAVETAKAQLLTAQNHAAADAFLRLNPGISQSGINALVAAGQVDPLIGRLAGLRLQADETSAAMLRLAAAEAPGARSVATISNARPGESGTRGLAGILGGAGSDIKGHLAEIDQVRAAQNQLDLSKARTSAQRTAILQREQSQTTDVAERLRIQAQIENERNSGAKAHTSELNKQLKLNEGIRDSLEKQYQSQLDASIALIEDRKQRRAEQREINQANRVLNTPGANADQKAAAADVLAEIPLQQERRRLAINEQLATANGKIINGKIYQSVPGSGGVGVGGAPLPAGVAGQAAGAQAPGGAGGPVVQFVVDGKVIAQAIIPYVTGAMVGGLRGAGAAGVGSRP